jgi:putative transposase
MLKHPHPYQPSKNARLVEDIYSEYGQPIFITIRAYRFQFPFRDQSISRMVIETLIDMALKGGCLIHAYCLMLDHIHYLLSPKKDGVSVLEFTNQFKGKTTNLSWKKGWSGKLWQPRFYDHILRKDEDVWAISEYILQNPLRKGYVSSVQDWPWSGTR